MGIYDVASLKHQLTYYNKKYRKGKPEISDEEYDTLLEKLQFHTDEKDFKEFCSTLMDIPGDVDLPIIMGSMKKCTYGRGELQKWIDKNNVNRLFVTEKIDGMSFCATYENGKFKQLTTRGDGYKAQDITEKGYLILPPEISYTQPVAFRGEFVLTEKAAERLGYANARNGTSGLMTSETYNMSDLCDVQVYMFGAHVLNGRTDLSIQEQFSFIDRLFEDWQRIRLPKYNMLYVHCERYIEESLKEILENSEAQQDGLVIYADDWTYENEYYPEKARAFKVNKEGVTTEVTGVTYEISKNGLFKPVAQLKPVRIDGTTVSNVTVYNYAYTLDEGIGKGAIVKIVKSGEIIPKIVEVIKKADSIYHQVSCPHCGGLLERQGVDLKCPLGTYCPAAVIKQMDYFLRENGIEGASSTSMIKWGINNFADLAMWIPKQDSKSQWTFFENLRDWAKNKSEEEMFASLSFEGCGKKTIKKLLKLYGGLTNLTVAFETNDFYNGYPDGVGEKTVNKILDSYLQNIKTLTWLEDAQWWEHTFEEENTQVVDLKGKSFCFTGTLTHKRKDLEQMVEDNGGEIKSVGKKLDYLVAGPGAGSKLTKAQDLGIVVLNEEQFMEMFNVN